MGTIRVLSVIFLILVVLIGGSDASSRGLLADEKPNPDKASTSTTTNPQTVDKGLNQKPQRNPVGSQPDISKKDEGVKESKGHQNDEKGDGQKESEGAPKNEEEKNDDKVKESNDPSKSTENARKDDGPKESDGTGNTQNDGGTKEGEGSSGNKDIREKDDGTKEGEGTSENKENKKKGDGTREGGSSSENKENMKKDDGTKAGEGSSENKENVKKDDGTKEGEVSSESKENLKKDDGTKEGEGSSKNKENVKKDDGTKEGEGSSGNKENAKKDDGNKEGEGSSENKENIKKDDGTKEGMKEGEGSSNKENMKKDDGTKEGKSSENKENSKKDGGTKEGEDPSKSTENRKDDAGKDGRKGPNGEDSHIDNKSQLEMCDGSLQKCQQPDLVACLENSETGLSKELVMVVQNIGDNTLDVNIAVPSSVRVDSKLLNLAKHSAKKVNISAGDTKTLRIVLNAGTGDCIIEIGIEPSLSDWMQQFPVYAKQLSPIYGVYFVCFVLLIAAGVWGCCRLRREKRAGDGVPYQQLEMGAQRHSNSEIIEESTIDGWEQDWDNDWDEEEGPARPSATSPNGNISSNGLSSRSANKKNDWDIEWDD